MNTNFSSSDFSQVNSQPAKDRSLAVDYSELLCAPLANSRFRVALHNASYACLLAARDTLREGFQDDPTRLQRIELAIAAADSYVVNAMRQFGKSQN